MTGGVLLNNFLYVHNLAARPQQLYLVLIICKPHWPHHQAPLSAVGAVALAPEPSDARHHKQTRLARHNGAWSKGERGRPLHTPVARVHSVVLRVADFEVAEPRLVGINDQPAQVMDFIQSRMHLSCLCVRALAQPCIFLGLDPWLLLLVVVDLPLVGGSLGARENSWQYVCETLADCLLRDVSQWFGAWNGNISCKDPPVDVQQCGVWLRIGQQGIGATGAVLPARFRRTWHNQVGVTPSSGTGCCCHSRFGSGFLAKIEVKSELVSLILCEYRYVSVSSLGE